MHTANTDLIFIINPFPCRDFPLKGKDAMVKRTTNLKGL